MFIVLVRHLGCRMGCGLCRSMMRRVRRRMCGRKSLFDLTFFLATFVGCISFDLFYDVVHVVLEPLLAGVALRIGLFFHDFNDLKVIPCARCKTSTKEAFDSENLFLIVTLLIRQTPTKRETTCDFQQTGSWFILLDR